MSISINMGNQISDQIVDASEPCTVAVDSPYILPFVPQVDGTLSQIFLERTVNPDAVTTPATQALSLLLSKEPNPTVERTTARLPFREPLTHPGTCAGRLTL